MNLFDLLVLILYVVAVGTVVLLLYRALFPPVIIVEQPVEASWWPWSVTSYNYWPYWSGGGGDGGYVAGPSHTGPSHELPRPWGGSGRGANAGGFHH
jgi:hypothetical protein